MKKNIKILSILVIPLLLCGCSFNKEDNKKCIEGHMESRIRFYPTSSGQMNMYVVPEYVCDKWEEQKENE